MKENDTIFPCDCGDDHFLRLRWWPDDTRHCMHAEGYLHIGGNFFTSLPRRAKIAWQVLRRGHAENYVGIVLTAETAREAAVALGDYADAAAAASAPVAHTVP